MKPMTVLPKLLFLAGLLSFALGERLFLRDARYPAEGCDASGIPVPNVIGIFDVIAAPTSIVLQWLDPFRTRYAASPCDGIIGNAPTSSEPYELKLSMTYAWNMHYAIDLVDGSFSTGTTNRTYGQHSIQISTGNEKYAISLGRESSYQGWPDVNQNVTQTTYLILFFELEWNGTVFPGVVTHEDTSKNDLFDCSGHPTEVFANQADTVRPTYCPLGVGQTYYPRIRFEHSPVQETPSTTIIEVPVPVPVSVPVPVPVPGPAQNTSSCPVCEDTVPEEPIACARRAQDGSALFLAGLQSESTSVSSVFVLVVLGCVLALLLLIAFVILFAMYIRKRRQIYRKPGFSAHDDYIVSLSEGSNQAMHDIRPSPTDNNKRYRDHSTSSSTPRAASEAEPTDPPKSTK